MDQPTQDRLKKMEEKQEDFDKRLKEVEQNTEPIKTPPYFQYQLSNVQENVTIIKVEMKEARADISQLKESQADLRDRLVEHGKHLEAIREDIDAQKVTLGDLLNYAEKHDKTLEIVSTKDDISGLERNIGRLEETMATKEDIKTMVTTQDFAAFEGRMVNLIRQLLDGR